MRLTLAQLNFTLGALEQTFTRIGLAVSRAKAADADRVVFSEMAGTSYPPRDLLNHAGFSDRHRYPMAVDYQGLIARLAPVPESSQP